MAAKAPSASGRASLAVLVLAAGRGTRMRSGTIKLLHPVANQPMLSRVLDAAESLSPSVLICVIGFQAESVRDALGPDRCRFVLQKDQRGTGHAVMQAAREIRAARADTLLILNGDLPTLRPETLRALLAAHRRSGSVLTMLTTELDEPGNYGRVVREDGSLVRIVEAKDASAAERRIREINCGIYCAEPTRLLRVLGKLRPDNAQREYYLTDAVHALLRQGHRLRAICREDPEEVLGVNTRAELARASLTLYARKATELQEAGVTLLDPARTRIDPRARLGRDTVIHPDVAIEGSTVLGEGCTVLPGSRLSDCRLGRRVLIKDHCVLVDALVGDDAQIGPFAHLRPGSVLDPGTRVGNFVELKKTRMGRGSKAQHLTYLGDATVGRDCNIGAGTITCNYDGKHKNETRLGDGVFIGSDTQLIAPVTVGRGAYVAAGTTVTKDVPPGALAIGRGRQRNVADWVARRNRD